MNDLTLIRWCCGYDNPFLNVSYDLRDSLLIEDLTARTSLIYDDCLELIRIDDIYAAQCAVYYITNLDVVITHFLQSMTVQQIYRLFTQHCCRRSEDCFSYICQELIKRGLTMKDMLDEDIGGYTNWFIENNQEDI
jgi:hypothetical protein